MDKASGGNLWLPGGKPTYKKPLWRRIAVSALIMVTFIALIGAWLWDMLDQAAKFRENSLDMQWAIATEQSSFSWEIGGFPVEMAIALWVPLILASFFSWTTVRKLLGKEKNKILSKAWIATAGLHGLLLVTMIMGIFFPLSSVPSLLKSIPEVHDVSHLGTIDEVFYYGVLMDDGELFKITVTEKDETFKMTLPQEFRHAVLDSEE